MIKSRSDAHTPDGTIEPALIVGEHVATAEIHEPREVRGGDVGTARPVTVRALRKVLRVDGSIDPPDAG